MAVDHRRHLPDHLAAADRGNHVVTRRGEIGGKAGAIDRLVEYAIGDAVEKLRLAGSNAPDLDGHRKNATLRRASL